MGAASKSVPQSMPIPPAPNPIGNPIRQLLVLQSVPHRWPFALRAALCVAVPVLVGWAVGDVAAGLLATIGGFTALYGSGRPYLNRAVHLAVIAVCLGLSVALGNWAAEVPWAGVLTVSAIAVAAVLLCNALLVGPPGAYMFVLACAAGIGAAHEHVAPWRIGLLVLAGGAFAWLVHMSGALIRFRGPEKSAVVSAAESVAGFIEAVGSSAEDVRTSSGRSGVASVVECADQLPAAHPGAEQHIAPTTCRESQASRCFRRGHDRGGRQPATAGRAGAEGPRAGYARRLHCPPLTAIGPATICRWAGPGRSSCCARRSGLDPQRFLSWLGLVSRCLLQDSSPRRWASITRTGRCRQRC